MKAQAITTGTAPRVIACPGPSPAAGNLVLVKVEAAALNTVDLHIASGHHRAEPPQLPYVPAIEAAGTIVAGPDQGLRVRAQLVVVHVDSSRTRGPVMSMTSTPRSQAWNDRWGVSVRSNA